MIMMNVMMMMMMITIHVIYTEHLICTFIKNFLIQLTVVQRDIKGTYYCNIHFKIRKLSLIDYLQAKKLINSRSRT